MNSEEGRAHMRRVSSAVLPVLGFIRDEENLFEFLTLKKYRVLPGMDHSPNSSVLFTSNPFI